MFWGSDSWGFRMIPLHDRLCHNSITAQQQPEIITTRTTIVASSITLSTLSMVIPTLPLRILVRRCESWCAPCPAPHRTAYGGGQEIRPGRCAEVDFPESS